MPRDSFVQPSSRSCRAATRRGRRPARPGGARNGARASCARPSINRKKIVVSPWPGRVKSLTKMEKARGAREPGTERGKRRGATQGACRIIPAHDTEGAWHQSQRSLLRPEDRRDPGRQVPRPSRRNEGKRRRDHDRPGAWGRNAVVACWSAEGRLSSRVAMPGRMPRRSPSSARSAPPVSALILGVTDAAQCQEMVQEVISRHGRLDILMDNARVGHPKAPKRCRLPSVTLSSAPT